MNISDVLGIITPIVYILVGCALVWFIIELIMTLRKTRHTVDGVVTELEPTLKNVAELTDQAKPVLAKVDPLVDRVSLTVDAANLELMRVDQILEDVTEITDSVSSTLETVDSVTNAPMELVKNVSNRVSSAFKSKKASATSINMGKAEASAAANQSASEVAHKAVETVQSKVTSTVDTVKTATQEAVADVREQRADKKAAKEEKAQSRQKTIDEANAAAGNVLNAVSASVAQDTDYITGVASEVAASEPQTGATAATESAETSK